MDDLTALGPDCGPHCGATRDPGGGLRVGHCEDCHLVNANARREMQRHLAGEDVTDNGRTSG